MKKRILGFLLALSLTAGLLAMTVTGVSAASEMKTSAECIAVIKQWEGFSRYPYWDYAQWTVGYGTRCPSDMLEYYKTNGITEKEAEDLLANHLTGVEREVNGFLDSKELTFTQGQFDAMVSLTYNCGSGWIRETTGTLHNAIISGAAGNAFIRAIGLWCTAGGSILTGLVNRRLSEANMYLNGVYDKTPPENYAYVLLNANGGSVRYRIQAYDTELTADVFEEPTYGAYQFAGWFTDPADGEKVEKLDAATKGKTLYAHWLDGSGNLLPPNSGESGISGTVKVSDTLNVRSEPNTASGIVGRLNNGDQVTILDLKTTGNTLWGKISNGWISMDYVQLNAAGWQMLNGIWYYLDSAGSVQTGWQKIGGTWYYFTGSGAMQTGWQRINGVWYYFNSSGAMQTGWQKINGTWYYFNSSGAMQTGWLEVNGTKYYLHGNGAMQTGWQKIDGIWYYFNSSGAMQTGWLEVNGTKYYLNGNGAMQSGWLEVDGKRYYQDGNAGILTGTHTIDGKKYTFSESGELQKEQPETPANALPATVRVNDYLNIRKEAGFASLQVGTLNNHDPVYILELKTAEDALWGRISGGWICMDYVRMDTAGWQKLNGFWYYANPSGVVQTGWVRDGNTWYYTNADGAMQTGWLRQGRTWYYLRSTGAMATGWQQVGKAWYFFDGSGAMKTGWVYTGGKYYFMGADGAMKTGWVYTGGAYYYMNAGGDMRTGWLKEGNTWYYLKSSGAMAANETLTIDGIPYRFASSGAML